VVKHSELIGQKINNLTILNVLYTKKGERSRISFNCQCDCGNIKTIYSGHILNNKTKSCGCLNIKNRVKIKQSTLVGKTFHKLKVLEQDIVLINKHQQVYYKCQCICGNTISVLAASLKSKLTQSCGCSKKDKWKSKYSSKSEYLLYKKITKYLRTRLRNAMHREQKSGSAIRDLGCSVPELKQYLESKFQPGMTWTNHTFKGWHIDHIRPLSSFDLSDLIQFKQACHYTNLQPLWAADNLRKSDYYEHT